jgi:hypothetical protein
MTNAADKLKAKLAAAVIATIAKPDVPAKSGAAGPIIDAAIKSVGPEIISATNSEPFYQSRVTIGAIMTLIGGSYALVLDFMDGVPPGVDDLTGQLTAIIGAGVVLYGRWAAKRPIGQ